MSDLKNVPIAKFLKMTNACHHYGLDSYGRGWKTLYDALPNKKPVAPLNWIIPNTHCSLYTIIVFLGDKNISLYKKNDSKISWKSLEKKLRTCYDFELKFRKAALELESNTRKSIKTVLAENKKKFQELKKLMSKSSYHDFDEYCDDILHDVKGDLDSFIAKL